MSETGPDALVEQIKTAWELARMIEPARGKVSHGQVLALRTALETIEASRARNLGTDDEEIAATLATVYARCAVCAIAAGDEANADRWLAAAEELSDDREQLAELAAARKSHERYRALVHGRNRIANSSEREARKIWRELTKGQADAIADAANVELKAPRPLEPHTKMPTLYRVNGIGAGFYGRRDSWSDGSYATTHCISIVWVPVFPLSAWRVRDASGGYTIMAREQLSGFARFMRLAIPAAIVLLIVGASVSSYLNDPARLAKNRFDDVLAAAKTDPPDEALRKLDNELEHDLYHIDTDRAQRAGAEVVRLTASQMPKPFTVANVEQAGRVVHRYETLPPEAKGGVARTALVTALDGWLHDLGDKLETADARLTLLGYEANVSDKKDEIAAKIVQIRLAIAKDKEQDYPLDALAILAEDPSGDALTHADAIVTRLVSSPSLVLDAGPDLERWLAATKNTDLRAKATAARDAAEAARTEVEADGVTPKQLTAMLAKRPWDQRAALGLARNDAGAGKFDAAEARLAKLGTPGMLIRDARFALAQIAIARGKLEQADAMLDALLAGRLQRFAAASAALGEASKAAEERLKSKLDVGNIPDDLRRKVEAAPESEQRELIRAWFSEQLDNDTEVTSARDKYLALADIVPVSLAAGSVKLRRAQAMTGPAQAAMLQAAERTFLAIRTEAEGQPEFQINLGEIYARLGKVKESEAELKAVLDKKDPKLGLQVAEVYRNIGSVERAKQVATEVYGEGNTDIKYSAAVLLGLMAEGRDEDEAEGWFKKADQRDPFVKTSLLTIEGERLSRQGKRAECAAKFAEAARAHLKMAGKNNQSGFNNAAVAHQHRFYCSGDPAALRDAQAAFEQAYRVQPDDPIVTGNLAGSVSENGKRAVLGKHVEIRALRLTDGEIELILGFLLQSPERDAVLADLAADPDVRRGSELYAQYEVLAPNSTTPYEIRFAEAADRRDEAAAAQVVEHAKHAKALDTSDADALRAKWRSGARDAKYFEQLETDVKRLDEALGQQLPPKTRAIALYLRASAQHSLALYRMEPAKLARAIEDANQAMKLWPVLDLNALIAKMLIDDAGLTADGKTWLELRRTWDEASALDKLAADKSPLVAKIKSSPQVPEIVRYMKANNLRPTIRDLRLARFLGDAALETRAKAVLDDKINHLNRELDVLLSPNDETVKDDLAYIDRR